MSEFNPLQWLEERAKLNIQDVVIEGLKFQIMALDDEHLELIDGLKTYNEALEDAANFGVSLKRQRVCEMNGVKDDLDLLWSKAHEAKSVDPCIQHQLGEKVLEISGALDEIKEVYGIDQPVIDGDEDANFAEITLGQLENDAQAALNANA